MKNTMDPIIRRTQRYWYIDGLGEITVGLFFVVLSGYFLIQAKIKTSLFNPVLANLGLLTALLIVFWLFRYTLQVAKAHLTYPRTGYVAPPSRQKSSRGQRFGLTAFLVVVCISLFALTLRSPTPPSWTPLLMGAVTGLTLLALSYRLRLLRFTFLACALVLVGAVVAFFYPGEPLALALSSAADGVCFILSGGATLVRYLRSTLPPASAD